MSALGSSDVTVTVTETYIFNKKRRSRGRITFGDGAKTYPSGGVPMPAIGFFSMYRQLDFLQITDPGTGQNIKWAVNQNSGLPKLVGRRTQAIPNFVIEEAVTLTSNVGTLAYPPAMIIAATGTISAATKPLKPIPTGVSDANMVAQDIQVDWTNGIVQTKNSDAVSSLKVSYIPQQDSGFFSRSNMVIDEAVTLASGNNNIANAAAAMSYVYSVAGNKRLLFAHASASGKVLVTLGSSATNVIAANVADAGSAKVTYLKFSGLPDASSFVAAASISLSSQAKEFGKAAAEKNERVLPATAPFIIGNETTNFLEISLGGPSVTAAVNLAKYDWTINKITTAESSAQTAITDTGLLILAEDMLGASDSVLPTNFAPAAQTILFEAQGW